MFPLPPKTGREFGCATQGQPGQTLLSVSLRGEVIRMELAVISSAVLGFMLAIVLFGRAGKNADLKKKRLECLENAQENPVMDEFNESLYKRFFFPAMQSIYKALAKLIPQKKSKSGKDEETEKQLRLAGLYISASEFTFYKTAATMLIFFAFAAAGFFIRQDVRVKILIALFGAVLSILVPRYVLKAKISSRQQKIREQMPEVLDLISVCVEAGLSFDNAILEIAEKLQGPFVDELLILYREIQMGRPRRDALRNLSECSNISEMKTFCSSMSQADQLGIPINNILKVQAAQLRVLRKQQAQEKGMKAPVKMILPMVFFIFPVIFIILLGPTIIQLLNEFG